MAKMFYTLEETAARLGVDEEQVKQMANDGKLQQFRDRNKLMFKRDQVDSLASGTTPAESGGPIPMADSAEIESIDILSDTDTVNPLDATDISSGSGTDLGASDTSAPNNPNDATGISVYPWQKREIKKLTAFDRDGHPLYNVAGVSVPRSNGKTWLAAAVFLPIRKQATSSKLLPDGSILTCFGTGYRIQQGPKNLQGPRDVGLVKWQPNPKPVNADRTIRDAAIDSTLRNVFDPSP